VVRLGISFDTPTTRQQAVLDRWVFDMMRAEAKAHRHLQGTQAPRTAAGRRGAYRVESRHSVSPLLAQASTALKVVVNCPASQPGKIMFGELLELSCSGCAVRCHGALPPEAALVELQLLGEDEQLRLQGRVMRAEFLPETKRRRPTRGPHRRTG